MLGLRGGRFLPALSLLVFCGALLAGCGGTGAAQLGLERSTQPVAVPSEEARADVPDLVQGHNAFACGLFKASRPSADNFVLSPYGVYLPLAMAYAGAAGDTERAMSEALRFALPHEREHPAFNALNRELHDSGPGGDFASLALQASLWAQSGYPFEPPFLDLLATNYDAGVHVVDFGQEQASRQAINRWARESTKGRVKELLPPGSIDAGFTRLVLASVMHFQGAWERPFPPAKPAPFNRLDGSTVEVPAMTHDMDFPYAETPDCQAVELPYAGDEFSMVLLLPPAGEFESFTAGLNWDTLEAVLAALTRDSAVVLQLPKFSYSSSVALQAPLTEMGMGAAFEEADFSRISTEDLGIDDVYEQAFISVDELGTEAAAAGAVVMAAGLGETMVLDRPFLYLIRHRASGLILFIGQVTDPSQGAS